MMLRSGRKLRRSSLPYGSNWQHLLIWVASLSLAASAAAQGYRTDPIDEKAKNNGAIAQLCVKNPARYAQEKDKVLAYFSGYYFPSMTRTDEQDLGRLGDLRYRLFKYFLWPATNEQLQSDLTKLTYDTMHDIVAPRPANPAYHPAVRYNALLIIGMLDQTYAIEAGANRRPPVPYEEANKFLTMIVNAGAADKAPPPLVLGALIGLERHAQLRGSWKPDVAQARVAAMTDALLKLVSREQPIQEMDRDAYGWLRTRAAGVLAKLGNVGDKNAVHNALIKLIATSKSLDDRCEVAGLLERITYKDVKLDDAGTSEPMFALARELAAAEDKRAQDFQEQGGGGPGASRPIRSIGPEGLGPGASGASGEQETYPRRQVLARLTGLRAGLAKLKPALPTESQTRVDALLKAIDLAKSAVASKDTVELKLAEAMRAMAAAINKAVPAPEKPAATEKAAAAKASDTL